MKEILDNSLVEFKLLVQKNFLLALHNSVTI